MSGEGKTADPERGRLAFADAARAAAVFLVVANHALSYVPSRLDNVGWRVFVIRQLPVPMFFLCDGFLFFFRKFANASFDYRLYLKRSAQRLLIPWVIFSVLYTIARAVFEYAGMFERKVVVGRALGEILAGLYGSQVASQMYFLPALFLIRALAPLLRQLWKIPASAHLILYFVYTAAFHGIEPVLRNYAAPGFDPILHALSGTQFYLAGAFLARVFPLVSKGALPILAALLFSIPAARFATSGEPADVLAQHLSLFAAFVLFLAAAPRENRLSRIGKDTMGVYLLHGPPLLKATSMIFGRLIPWPTIAFGFTVVATFFLALFGSRFIRSRPYGRAVFGEFPVPLRT